MNENLLRTLRSLRLSGLAASLDIRLQEAAANRLAHLEFLELLLQDELLVRDQRRTGRRLKNAGFANLKTLDEFNWQFNPAIDRRRFDELATCSFVREHRDLLLIGPPGVGKSHLAQALGYRAVQVGFTVLYRSIFDLVRDFLQDEALAGQKRTMATYLRPDLLIIDDMGMKQLPRNSGEYLFEVVMRRYETRSTVMTSNRPIEDWGKLIGDVPAAGAILDRFLHHAEVIPMEGHSYRLGNRSAKEDLKANPQEVESLRRSGGF